MHVNRVQVLKLFSMSSIEIQQHSDGYMVIYIKLTLNSQPTVGVVESLTSLLLKRSARLDFPTPELPSSTNFTLRVFGIGL